VEEVVQGGAEMKILATAATLNTDGSKMFRDSCTQYGIPTLLFYNQPNVGVVQAYQHVYKIDNKHDVIVFMHDDVEIFDPHWAEEIDEMFISDPSLAIVGLGGATGIGTPDLYKRPYHITQLIRTNYASNQRDWQVHGTHETGIRDVAVVDGFFMAIRVKFLDEIGGWTWIKSDFHCYDLAMCLMAIRRGWKVKMIGLDCHHHGGGTSTRPEYQKWCEERGTDMGREHSEPHLWLANEFRDLLPYQIKGDS
jgi:GT2 family glycosyltransferase